MADADRSYRQDDFIGELRQRFNVDGNSYSKDGNAAKTVPIPKEK